MGDATEIDLEDLHSSESMMEERNYEDDVKTRKFNFGELLQGERKKTIVKVAAIIIALLFITSLLLSSSFGAGFGIGYAVSGGDSNNNSKNTTNNNFNDDNVPVEDYNYYQGYPYVYHSPADYQLDRSNPAEADLMETNEYQFKLNPGLFKKRMSGVRELLALVEQTLNITLNEKDAEEDCFTETQYLATDCGTVAYSELRIRSYVGGKLNASSESDINKDSSPHSSKENAMSYNVTPNPLYENEQKIEQDVHPCWYKFNKKTKIKNLPADYQFTTCADVVELFPESFDGHDLSQAIGVKYQTHFWEYKFKGHMQDGITKYKLSFDLAYKTIDQAISGDAAPLSGSEFSIRAYSPGDGMDPWNYKLLAELGDSYQFLLDNYGSYKEYPCS